MALPPVQDGRSNPVNRMVDAFWQAKGIARPPRADDRTFIRRASLDLVGLLPNPARVEAFVADSNPDKRRALVRELLGDAITYAEHWMTFWNDLLRNDYSGTGFITGGRRQITSRLHRGAPPQRRLEQLTAIMTKPENGWLSRTIVNRLWHRLMGRGLVHPVDSLRTRPWSEDLLEQLAVELVSHEWNLKHVLETIRTSEAYGSATPALEGQPRGADSVFMGTLPRRMTAEQFTDSVWQLTDTAPADPVARWIGSNDLAAAAPGEKVTFQRKFSLKAAPAHAVADVISTFDSIPTAIDGCRIVDGLPEIAKVLDRATLIRSHVQPDLGSILHSRHQYHWHTGHVPPQTVACPHLGAWMSRVLGPRNSVMPAFMNIGQRLERIGENEEIKAFTTAGFFGSEFGPMNLPFPRRRRWRCGRRRGWTPAGSAGAA